VDLILASQDGLQSLVTMLAKDSTVYGLQINKKKTKVMVFKRDMVQINPIIVVDGEQLETSTKLIAKRVYRHAEKFSHRKQVLKVI